MAVTGWLASQMVDCETQAVSPYLYPAKTAVLRKAIPALVVQIELTKQSEDDYGNTILDYRWLDRRILGGTSYERWGLRVNR